MRTPLLVGVVVAALALSACSGDDDDDNATESTRKEATTTSTTMADAEVALTRGAAVVASAGGDIALDEATQAAVVTAAQQYVDSAIISPLNGGTVAAEYDALFDTAVQANAIGADRAVLTDEGIPVPTETPAITATPVAIDALAGGDGTLALLATSFSVTVDAETASGPVAVRRTIELTYAKTNEIWLVTAYRVSVERDLAETEPTTTTAAAG